MEYLKRDLGHDLAKALSEAEAKSLQAVASISQQDRDYVAALNQYYQQKDLQYAETGYKPRPVPDAIIEFAERLVGRVQHYCAENRKRHHGKPTAVL